MTIELEKLDYPFPAADIEWRIQQSGMAKSGQIYAMVLAYVTNRAIMKRLDEVCGKAGWKNEFREAPDSGVMCGISIKIDGEWITKWDAAENTQVEAVKGGMSGAMKRAAVQWGIGRYLYNLTEGFAQVSLEKKPDWNRAKIKEGNIFWWLPPSLPQWALPAPIEARSEKPPLYPVRSPEEILADFTAQAAQENDIESLKTIYTAAWNAMATSAEHQTKCVEVFKIRSLELKKAS